MSDGEAISLYINPCRINWFARMDVGKATEGTILSCGGDSKTWRLDETSEKIIHLIEASKKAS
jgi:hypothetical protein